VASFFRPRLPAVWLQPWGIETAHSFYAAPDARRAHRFRPAQWRRGQAQQRGGAPAPGQRRLYRYCRGGLPPQAIERLLERLPKDKKGDADVAEIVPVEDDESFKSSTRMSVVHLIYREKYYESQAKD
jgi:patatin-like phospholipase